MKRSSNIIFLLCNKRNNMDLIKKIRKDIEIKNIFASFTLRKEMKETRNKRIESPPITTTENTINSFILSPLFLNSFPI